MTNRAKIGLHMLLALTACSYSYPIDATLKDGKLIFDAKQKMSGCLNDFVITGPMGEVMWSIESEFRSNPCQNAFPMTYGVLPKDMRVKKAATPIRVGVEYRIEGSDGDRYYGAFVIKRALIIQSDPELARTM